MARDTRVYVFVDHDKSISDLNTSVKNYAAEISTQSNVMTQIESTNLGPGKAMIRALDWAFNSEELLWILEDDVFPNAFSSEYINTVATHLLSSRNLLATARSPVTEKTLNPPDILGVSSFALTNGWLLTKDVWLKFKAHLNEPLTKEFLTFIFTHPFSIRREHFYFFAAASVSRSEIVQAWDTQFVFFCLINNIRTITPNKSCIEIRGVDDVASNTISFSGTTSDVFWKSDKTAPSTEISYENSISRFLDSMIINEIYHIRWRHIFSPVKSYLKLVKKRFV